MTATDEAKIAEEGPIYIKQSGTTDLNIEHQVVQFADLFGEYVAKDNSCTEQDHDKINTRTDTTDDIVVDIADLFEDSCELFSDECFETGDIECLFNFTVKGSRFSSLNCELGKNETRKIKLFGNSSSESDGDFDLFSDNDGDVLDNNFKKCKSKETNLQQHSKKVSQKSKSKHTVNVKAEKKVDKTITLDQHDYYSADLLSRINAYIMSTSDYKHSQTGLHSARRERADDDTCRICLDSHSDPKILPSCSHKFCTDCIDQHFKIKPVCPVCFTSYGVITGNQPEGTMKHHIEETRLPGYESCYTIVIDYNFKNGIQTTEHPNPGYSYTGTSRRAYLPNNTEGQKVLKLLKESFCRKLTFTVGRSRTTGADNTITWNDVHHKTSTHGGMPSFGYPDPTYLSRVQEELAAKGVTEKSLKDIAEFR